MQKLIQAKKNINFKERSYVVGIWTAFSDKNYGMYPQDDSVKRSH